MIRCADIPLPSKTQAELDRYQQEIDGLSEYEKRVSHAKKLFGLYNRKGNPTFDVVKASLVGMCSGAQRCGYCEDSAADEVEHIKPKSLYPEATFVWLNYLYSCGPCNGPKNNQYAVFDPNTHEIVRVQRKAGAPIVAPRAGAPVLIDPRTENPCDFLWLDLQSTFCFSPRLGIDAIARERAKYTIDTLGLNRRAYLRLARRDAMKDYCAHLKNYRDERRRGATASELATIASHMRNRAHPTVWVEMKRQHQTIAELKKLFRQVPEALQW